MKKLNSYSVKLLRISVVISLLLIAIVIAFICKKESQNQHIKAINIPLESAIYGIDVSNHQGEIAWDEVKTWKGKSLEFVYIKATEGSTFTDASYIKNVDGARKADLLVGMYHYFRTTSSPEKQFDHFKRTVEKLKQDLIPLVDIEERNNWDNASFHKNLQKFLNLVEEHYGKKPMLYTVNSFYNKYLSGKYKDYHFLIGRYSKTQPLMKDNHSWTLWQFTDKASVILLLHIYCYLNVNFRHIILTSVIL